MNQTIFWVFSIALFLGIEGSQTWALTNSSTSITIANAVHFVTPDGSDVLVEPGTYRLEMAEEWLRLVPGERKDALLLEASNIQHDEILEVATALSHSEAPDTHRIALLLPGGIGLQAIGSKSGIQSRAVNRRLSSRTKNPKQPSSRIPLQSKNTRGNQKSQFTSSSQPKNPLAQHVQTLEQEVRTLKATISALQNRLSKIESAIQVDNSGNMTITLAGKFKVNASIADISASTVTTNAGLSRFSGTVQSDTLITNSVVSSSYTPGAGNVW